METPSLGIITDWADIQDDDDTAFGEELEFDNKDGTISKCSWSENDKGQTVKTTTVVKITKKVRKRNMAVNERMKWDKLPQTTQNRDELVDDKLCVADDKEVSFEFPKTGAYRQDIEEDDDQFIGSADLTTPQMRSEIKNLFAVLSKEMVEDSAKKTEDSIANDKEDDQPSAAKYRAPWRERIATSMPARSLEDVQREECTVRVTNLSEDVKEKDLMDLFGQVGTIQRIFLAKHKETGGSKGFAFITYRSKDDAQKAITTLNRHGYDNLLLTVETAKHSNRQREGGDRPLGGPHRMAFGGPPPGGGP